MGNALATKGRDQLPHVVDRECEDEDVQRYAACT
jgi:hypothetical protein